MLGQRLKIDFGFKILKIWTETVQWNPICSWTSLFLNSANTEWGILVDHLSLLVVRSGHWCQENRACQWGLAPLGVPGDRSDLAHREVLVLFGPTQRTERGSGSVWSCSGTSGLQQEEERRSDRWSPSTSAETQKAARTGVRMQLITYSGSAVHTLAVRWRARQPGTAHPPGEMRI